MIRKETQPTNETGCHAGWPEALEGVLWPAGPRAESRVGNAEGKAGLVAALLVVALLVGGLSAGAKPPHPEQSAASAQTDAEDVQARGAYLPRSSEVNLPSEAEFLEFLRRAEVVASKQTSKGVTAPFKLTLSDGERTIQACFQAVNEFKHRADFPSRTEFNFRDSYQFNVAAYELAKLLGLGEMIPVTVEYKWKGKQGSLSLWVPAKWDEQERLKQNLQPPDRNTWNKQMNRMWVFCELVFDTDRNQTNILISEEWKLWMIDFSRAFRIHRELNNPKNLVMCDAELLERLRELDEAEVLEKTKQYLTKSQVQALMARRDKIVQHFETLLAQKGESAVLY
jgi:hypothetical protein